MATLTCRTEADQLALGQLGACEEMVKCLRAHRMNVDVTWMALAGLVNMTIAGTTRPHPCPRQYRWRRLGDRRTPGCPLPRHPHRGEPGAVW